MEQHFQFLSEKCTSRLTTLVDVVDHRNDIIVLRAELVVGRHDGEAEEHEDAHERVPVGPRALEADEHLVALELLFGELEQRDEGVARALGQHARRYVHVEHAIREQRLPLDLALVRERTLEAEQHRVGLVGQLVEVHVVERLGRARRRRGRRGRAGRGLLAVLGAAARRRGGRALLGR